MSNGKFFIEGKGVNIKESPVDEIADFVNQLMTSGLHFKDINISSEVEVKLGEPKERVYCIIFGKGSNFFQVNCKILIPAELYKKFVECAKQSLV